MIIPLNKSHAGCFDHSDCHAPIQSEQYLGRISRMSTRQAGFQICLNLNETIEEVPRQFGTIKTAPIEVTFCIFLNHNVCNHKVGNLIQLYSPLCHLKVQMDVFFSFYNSDMNVHFMNSSFRNVAISEGYGDISWTRDGI